MLKITVLPIIIILILGLILGFSYQEIQKRQLSGQDAAKTDNAGESGEKTGSESKQTEDVSPDAVPSPKKLDLSGRGLAKVPADVFSKTYLEELDLSGNQLTGAMPAEIRFLQNLRILNLSGNRMTGVPAEVGQLSKLEVLDLANNQLTGLPYELGNLKNLKVLRLSGNDYSKQDLEVIKKGLPASVLIE